MKNNNKNQASRSRQQTGNSVNPAETQRGIDSPPMVRPFGAVEIALSELRNGVECAIKEAAELGARIEPILAKYPNPKVADATAAEVTGYGSPEADESDSTILQEIRSIHGTVANLANELHDLQKRVQS